ncbi:hypothetical protein CEXT_404901 [Caerostris extrusa]|uniref:Uncharacterized protein n=1 Tax=Caerostris extrusa TaxID=172846 RepID=A0AAV4NRK1_CAEEX|nr:hypothetical protein CEXT_404901 [Caerostris extrusa]
MKKDGAKDRRGFSLKYSKTKERLEKWCSPFWDSAREVMSFFQRFKEILNKGDPEQSNDVFLSNASYPIESRGHFSKQHKSPL